MNTSILFKPSSLIAILMFIIFILMAFCPNQSQSFYQIAEDAIKVLSGALAGAVAGERIKGKSK